MWFSWATRGVFLGQRRINYSAQIDDWFTTADINYGVNGSQPIYYRASGEDCSSLIDQQKLLTKQSNDHHGTGDSLIMYELAYNGAMVYQNIVGSSEDEEDWNVMTQCVIDNMDEFYWVSHTWTHPNLNLNPECKDPNTNDTACLERLVCTVYIRINTHVHVHIFTLCIYVTRTRTRIHIRAHTHTHTHTHTYTCIYVYVYVYLNQNYQRHAITNNTQQHTTTHTQ